MTHHLLSIHCGMMTSKHFALQMIHEIVSTLHALSEYEIKIGGHRAFWRVKANSKLAIFYNFLDIRARADFLMRYWGKSIFINDVIDDVTRWLGHWKCSWVIYTWWLIIDEKIMKFHRFVFEITCGQESEETRQKKKNKNKNPDKIKRFSADANHLINIYR